MIVAFVSIIQMIFAVLIVQTILSTQFSVLFFFVQLILPLLGIAGGIFLLKRKNVGWYLGLV